jgi:hypothetical protein
LNLQATIELYGGGPGSGCRGPNCGRPGYPASDNQFVAKFRDEKGWTDTTPGSRQNPIEVGDDVKRAVRLVRQGKHVVVNQPEEVATLIEKIKNDAAIFKSEGKPIPDYNLEDITVEGKNLFRGDLGVPRVNMPQTAGLLMPDSPALPSGADPATYEADLTPQFIQSMREQGIATQDVMVPASHLRPTQEQLDGSKVGAIADRIRAGTLPSEPIFITKDNYILDGHHRWAAQIVADAYKNRSGDVMIPAHQLNVDIGKALSLAAEFQEKWKVAPALVTGQKVWWLPGQPTWPIAPKTGLA